MFGKSKLLGRFRRDFVGQGDALYRRGNLRRAAELYARAKQFSQAARISLENGDSKAAVDYHLQAGSPLEAGEVLASVGDDRAAVEHFEKAEAWWQAGEAALRIGRQAVAGRYFEKAEAFRSAADCYEEAGEIESAVRALEKEASSLDPDAVDGDQGKRQIDLRRAQLLEKVGRFEEAADLLSSLHDLEHAGRLYARARNYDRAVEVLFAARAFSSAAELLPKAENVDHQIRSRILFQSGEFSAAARCFEDAGLVEEAAEAYERATEWQRSALLWERLGELANAARLFLKSGLSAEAARCFVEMGDHAAAARAFGEAGALVDAARSYEAVGEYLAAALRFQEAGDLPSARRALQRIDHDHPDFEVTAFRLIGLLLEEGLFKGALHRLSMMTAVVGSEAAAEKLYWEGRVYEGLEEFARAALSYQKVAAISPEFKDVSARMESVEDRQSLTTQVFEVDSEEPAAATSLLASAWLSPGELIAERYCIEGEIGRGGMSRVYDAVDREFGDRVALKILIPRSEDDGRAEERLLQEVRVCRRISHPNVVRVFDFGRFRGGVFITMELLEGETVDQRVRSEGPFEFASARTLFLEILSGLAEAHLRRVIHRDLKPMNVFLTAEGAKIMDFGIARSEEGDPSLTRTGHVVGSPMFMSPEQLQGHTVDARSDLYSFGVLAFFVLAGREPFTGTTVTALALKHLGEPAPKLGSFREGTPEEWEIVLARLLAKDAEDRFASAEEVVSVVEGLPV